MTDFVKRSGSSSKIIRTPAAMVKGILNLLNIFKVSSMDPEQYQIADLEVTLDTSAVTRDLGWQSTEGDTDILLAAYGTYEDSKN